MTPVESIRAQSEPLEPRPTGERPRLQQLPGIRAVVFDIYGTLIISASGDVGLSKPGANARFEELIREHQRRRRADGIEFPEVEIREVWRELAEENGGDTRGDFIEQVAIDYECRSNPTWPMPNLESTLDVLSERGFPLGIISNAQFYTPHLFPAHTGRSLAELGFCEDLQVWSYQELEGKPSTRLFEKSARQLLARGIAPEEVLYVGNDLRNDIWPAQLGGFRTALFAGDARSLRWREDDARVAGVQPDLILTELQQLLECVPSSAVSS